MDCRSLVFALLVALPLAACTSSSPPQPERPAPVAPGPIAANVVTPPVAPTPEPAAAPAPAPPASAEDAAIAAYRAAVAATDERDEAKTIASLTDRLTCFHGKRDVARADVARTSAAIHALAVLESTPDRIVLVDWGHTYPADEEAVVPELHTKAVALARTPDGWKISAEGAGKRMCGFDLGKLKPPPAIAKCRAAYGKQIARAKACRCDNGSTDCNYCQSQLDSSTLEDCVDAATSAG